MIHTLPSLAYEYNALEPVIDEKTMRIHHTKHHQTYIDKLNDAIKDHPDLVEKDIQELLKNLETLPDSIKTAVQNNGGGHYNHTLFWQMLSPQKQECKGKIATLIEQTFGSYDAFEKELTNAALTRFGSGWAWLVQNSDGSLEIISTPNQDTPLSQGKKPLLGIDVWEHAYYLTYQNKRPEYLKQILTRINWEFVNEQLS
ncbi:MAG: superoxide dismutase [Candidatus Woesearchaeota archaeon]